MWTPRLFLKVRTDFMLVVVVTIEVFPVLEKRNLAGLIFFVILILLAAVTGLLIYLRRKRMGAEREPLTNGPSMTSLQDK